MIAFWFRWLTGVASFYDGDIDAAPSEIHCQRQAHRATSGNEGLCFLAFKHCDHLPNELSVANDCRTWERTSRHA